MKHFLNLNVTTFYGLLNFLKNAIGSSHPVMHKIVGDHVKEYIKEDTNMKRFFQRLINSNKKLFLVTNSPFHFYLKYIFHFTSNQLRHDIFMWRRLERIFWCHNCKRKKTKVFYRTLETFKVCKFTYLFDNRCYYVNITLLILH